MTESDITVLDQASGVDVRGILRSVGGANKFMQGLTNYRGAVPSTLVMYAQLSTNGFTLPNSWTAKPNEQSGTTTTATHYKYLVMRPFRPDADNVAALTEGSVSSGTTILDRTRFFQAELFYEPLIIKGTVRFYANANVKSSGATACTLTGIKAKLRALTGTDTYVDITDEVELSFGTAISNATTAYVAASAKTDMIFAPATASGWAAVNYSLATTERLCLELTLVGTVGSAMTATACVNADAGSSLTCVEIPLEEAI